MRVLITGATGTIGLAVADALRARGDQVVALSRDPERGRRVLGDGVEVHPWARPTDESPPVEAIAGAAAVIHLVGEPVAQRWTAEAKARIRDSRVLATSSLVTALNALPEADRPRALVSQSATGYYGDRGDAELDEHAPAGDDFLAAVVVAWEREALRAEQSTRVACTRTGVALSPSGGALAKMLPFFRLGIGGPVAGGRQYVPWVHLDDVVGAMLACVDDDALSGPVNVTAPTPVTNGEFSRALGHALSRPAVLPVPGLAVKALYGEMAEIVTTGQRAVPARLLAAGYEFRQPQLEPALRDVLGRR
jgi:uncharacterized protein (TIGR01777 family)